MTKTTQSLFSEGISHAQYAPWYLVNDIMGWYWSTLWIWSIGM